MFVPWSHIPPVAKVLYFCNTCRKRNSVVAHFTLSYQGALQDFIVLFQYIMHYVLHCGTMFASFQITIHFSQRL